MKQIDYSSREKITTGKGPMDLDGGALRVKEAVRVLTLATMGTGAGAVALALALLLGELAALRWPVISEVAAVLSAGATLAAALLWCGAFGLVGVYSWRVVSHQLRLERWHRAELAAYRVAGGAQVDRQMAIRALTIHEPQHVLNVALALAERARRNELPAASVAALTGDIWLGRVKVGELSKRQAELFVMALKQVGVITGGRKGAAGQLATTDPGQIIELVSTRAGRIRELPARPDEDE